MKNVKPIIYEYTDYRLYLKALYEFEKTHGDFSYSTFAQRAGFQARSYLRTGITGKRNLTANAIEKVIVEFDLELSEGEAFRALVRFNQCQTFSEKHHYWDQFLKQRPKKSKSVVVDEYYYLARMAYPILLVILKQNHIKNTMEELSRLTGLSKSELQDGLQTLEKIAGSTAEVRRLIQEGKDLLKVLNTAVPNKFRDQPAILAEWQTASHVRRRNRKSDDKKDGTDPAAPTPPSK